MRNSAGGWEEELTGSLIGLFVLFAIVALAFLIWACVRVAHTIAAGFGHAPRSKVLWLSLAATVAFPVLAIISGAAWLLVGSALSLIVLLICAKAIELSHAPLFLREASGEEMVSGIIHVDEWWQS